MRNMALEYVIALQPYHIGVIFRFKKTINLRICKASITTEEPQDVRESVTGNNWFQNTLPVIGLNTVNYRLMTIFCVMLICGP